MEERDLKQKLKQKIAELEARLAELEARLPAHSVPPAMMMGIEELEEELTEARSRLAAVIEQEEE